MRVFLILVLLSTRENIQNNSCLSPQRAFHNVLFPLEKHPSLSHFTYHIGIHDGSLSCFNQRLPRRNFPSVFSYFFAISLSAFHLRSVCGKMVQQCPHVVYFTYHNIKNAHLITPRFKEKKKVCEKSLFSQSPTPRKKQQNRHALKRSGMAPQPQFIFLVSFER